MLLDESHDDATHFNIYKMKPEVDHFRVIYSIERNGFEESSKPY